MKIKSLPLIIFILFLAGAYFPLFLHLDALPMSFYDEARPAVNAIEMSKNHNFLVAQFYGEPDMWYSKPPLSIWLQVIGIKLLGYNELAVRLPSALAGLALVLFLVWFGKKNGSIIWGYFSAMVLLTTQGFISEHVTRTADPDTLLCLFSTAYILLFYQFIKSERRKYLYFCAIAIALAGLTKGVAGFLFLPGILVYAIYTRRLVGMLKKLETYGAVLVAILPVLSFYLLREYYNPGYLQAVSENELGGRFLEVIEEHQHPFGYYLDYIWREHFSIWIGSLPLAIWLAFISKPAQRRLQFLIYSTLLIYLLLISTAQTKLFWYTAPIFPLLALSVGFVLYKGYNLLSQALTKEDERFSTKVLFPIFFVFTLFFFPYRSIIQKIYHPQNHFVENSYGLFLNKMKSPAKEIKIPSVGVYNCHIDFYIKAFNERGYNLASRYSHELHVNDTLLICELKNFNTIDALFECELIEKKNSCSLMVILDRR